MRVRQPTSRVLHSLEPLAEFRAAVPRVLRGRADAEVGAAIVESIAVRVIHQHSIADAEYDAVHAETLVVVAFDPPDRVALAVRPLGVPLVRGDPFVVLIVH